MLDQFQLKWVDIVDHEYCSGIITKHDCDLHHLVQETEDYQSRDVYIKAIDINEYPELLGSILHANDEFFKFQLGNSVECYFAKYPTGSHYNTMHMDCKSGLDHMLQRKISFTLTLNDEYEGGEFCVHDHTLEAKKGRLLVFPSFLLHAVNKITAGTRYCVFGFFLGPDWR